MYDYHYNHIKSTYHSNSQLLFTVTDSLVYEIQTDYLYQDMKITSDFHDFSAYPQNHFCFDISNKNVIRKFRNECTGIGLRSKMYWITDGDSAKKTAKGVNRLITERELHHQTYKSCLFSGVSIDCDASDRE